MIWVQRLNPIRLFRSNGALECFILSFSTSLIWLKRSYYTHTYFMPNLLLPTNLISLNGKIISFRPSERKQEGNVRGSWSFYAPLFYNSFHSICFPVWFTLNFPQSHNAVGFHASYKSLGRSGGSPRLRINCSVIAKNSALSKFFLPLYPHSSIQVCLRKRFAGAGVLWCVKLNCLTRRKSSLFMGSGGHVF